MKQLLGTIEEVIKRKYQEKWIFKTISTIILSLLSFIIVFIITFYKQPDMLFGRIFELFNTGSLYIVSLSLMTNFISKSKNISPINESFIRVLKIIAIILGLLIAMFYGASYEVDKNIIVLQRHQKFISIMCYVITILLIAGINFLNRTDMINDVVTNQQEDKLIEGAESENLVTEGLEIWLNSNIFWLSNLLDNYI